MKNNILSLFAGLGIWAGLLTSPMAMYAQEDMSAYDIDIDVTMDDVASKLSNTEISYNDFSNGDYSFTSTAGRVAGDGYMYVAGMTPRASAEFSVALKGHNIWSAGTYDVYVVMVPLYYQSGEVPAEGATIAKNKMELEVAFMQSITDTQNTIVQGDVIYYQGTKVDTVLAMQDVVFPVTYYKGYNNVFPTISITCLRPTSAEQKEGYVNKMCIDRIILKAKSVTPGQTVLNGNLNENVSYSLDTQTGTLTFSGSGDVNGSPEIGEYMKSEIRNVVVEEGITGFHPGRLSSSTAHVSLPSTLKDFGNTFQGSSITSLTVPASVERIADYAFEGSQLTSITFLGNAIKTIGEYAFSNIPMTGISLPNGVEAIGARAFENTPLATIELPGSLQTIGDYAFSQTSIKHIDIPEGVKTIGEYVFRNGQEKLESINLPSSLETIGDSAFYTTALTEITLPSGIKSLGSNLFADAPLHKLTWDVRFSMDMGDISAKTHPFYSVRAQIDTFYIGNNAVHLPDGLCQNMGIAEIVIPEGVQTIGAQCFDGCYFDILAIPASVKNIGERAFIREYSVDAANTAYCDVDGVLFSKDKTELLCYPHYRYGNYSIPEGVSKVSIWAFGEMSRVDIPVSVRTLGLDIFANTRLITTKWTTAEELPTLLPSQNDAYPFTVQIPYGSMDVYKQADGWKNSTLVYEYLVGNALTDKPTFSLFQQMMQATGWDKELMKLRDEEYGYGYESYVHPTEGQIHAPEHRYYGYTVFAEKNTVFETLLGKNADAISLSDLTSYLSAYYEGKTDEDYASEDHVLNRFVSYHLLPVKLPENKLVIHYSEVGYYYEIPDQLSSIPVMEYYETMGKGRRLMKMSESAVSDGVRINRFMKTDRNTGHEIEEAGVEGIVINKEDAENASYLNGYLYALDELLVYSNEVRSRLGSERMRHDMASLLPELTNNDMRLPDNNGAKWLMPDGYPYFENVTLGEGTKGAYLSGYGMRWRNYQGDEMNFWGQYDVTIKLPAVPENGVYELRLGFGANAVRGMAQAYVGTDKENLQPCGLPIDFRTKQYVHLAVDLTEWKQDTGDEVVDQLNDLRLREKGYMKGIDSHQVAGDSNTFRDYSQLLRRIIGQFQMEAGETYYLRLKSCLPDADTQLMMDFIELVPEKVYNNPAEPEDRW